MCAALLLALLAVRSALADPSALAPGFTELDAAVTTLKAQAVRAEASQVALERIHNRLAERLAAEGAVLCEDPTLARTSSLLAAWRASAQTARMDLARLRRVASSSTLAPVLDARARADLETLTARVDRQVPAWLEAAAWQSRFVDPVLERCQPVLAPGPGLPDPLAPERPATGPVAVVGFGGGLVCPGDHPADGGVVVLPAPEACYGPVDCACFVEPVLPGAVLGPPPELEPPASGASPEPAPAGEPPFTGR